MRACSIRSWLRPATAIGSNWIEPSLRSTASTDAGFAGERPRRAEKVPSEEIAASRIGTDLHDPDTKAG